jgi:hypothetical protein
MPQLDRTQHHLLCELVNSLQRTCYQLRFLEIQQFDLDSEWLIDEEDTDTLAEIMLVCVDRTHHQLFDTALLNKSSLLDLINRLLKANSKTNAFSLHSDPKSSFRIVVEGGIENKAGLKFMGVGKLNELEDIARKEGKKRLFLSRRDFGEINMASSELLDGEFYCYSGDQMLADIFWPFLIELDGTCYSVNDPNSLVIDIECSEK